MPEIEASHYPVPPMANTMPKTYFSPPAPMPSGRVYTYPYMSPLVIPSPPIVQVEINLATLFTQSPPVQNVEEMKKQERKRVELMMQPASNET